MHTVSLEKTRTLMVTNVAGLLALIAAAIAFLSFPAFSLANPAMCGLQQVNDATFVNFLKFDPNSPAGKYEYITTPTNPSSTLLGQLVLVKVNGKNMPAVISNIMGNGIKGITNSAGTYQSSFSLRIQGIPTASTQTKKESSKGAATTAVFSSFLDATRPTSGHSFAYISSNKNQGGNILVGQWILAKVNGQIVPVVLSGKVMNGSARGLNPLGITIGNVSLKITNIPAGNW